MLRRDEAYIGVLIDDLVTKGVDEPYRMFTSRAEFRILLRQDNADVRLTPYAIQYGLADAHRTSLFTAKKNATEELIRCCKEVSIRPEKAAPLLETLNSSPLQGSCKASELLARPGVTLTSLLEISPTLKRFADNISERKEEILEAAEVEIKYAGYIHRERLQAEKMQRLEEIRIRGHFDYASIHQLSTEARQKLAAINPETLGQASRIPGVSPSDISVLLILCGR